MLRISVILVLATAIRAFGQGADTSRFAVAFQRADSTTKARVAKLDSLDAASHRALMSIKLQYDSIFTQATMTEAKLQRQFDSLSRLKLDTHGVSKKIDSTRQEIEASLKNVTNKWEAVRSKASNEVASVNVPPPWDQGKQHLSKAISELNLKTPSNQFNWPSLAWKPHSIELPGMNDPLKGLSINTGIGNLPVGQLDTYKSQATQLANGNPDQLVDAQVAKLDEVQMLQKQNSFMNEQLDIQKMTDVQAAKEQYINLGRKAAMEHFKGKFDQVDQAMKKMQGYKKKYDNVQSIKDLPEKVPNEMKGKPLRVRLVRALALQLQQQRAWMLDVNPSLGYRFSGHFVGGAGWNHRIAYDFKQNDWVRQATITGPRIFGEYMVNKKGLALLIETDYMKTTVSYYNKLYSDPTINEWIWGCMVGLRKPYSIARWLDGNLQVLYNVVDPHDKSPYQRLNIRLGFEWKPKEQRMKRPKVNLLR